MTGNILTQSPKLTNGKFISDLPKLSAEQLVKKAQVLSFYEKGVVPIINYAIINKVDMKTSCKFLEKLGYIDANGNSTINIADVEPITIYGQLKKFMKKNHLGEIDEDSVNNHENHYIKKKNEFHNKKSKFKKNGKKNMYCTFCHKTNHTEDKCFKKQKESTNFLIDEDNYESDDDLEFNYNISEINVKTKEKEFLVDCGSTTHIVKNKKNLTNLRPKITELGTIGHSVVSEWIGDYQFNDNLILKNVLYVPTASRNIISASKLIKEGYKICLNHPAGILDERGKIVAKIIHHGNLFKTYGKNFKHSTFNITHATENEIVKAHIALGHAGYKQLRSALERKEYSSKMIKKVLKECSTCAGNVTLKHGSQRTTHPVTKMGERLSADILGPIDEQYGLVVRDSYSGYIIGKILENREDASEKLISIIKMFIKLLEIKSLSVVYLRTDNEFRTAKLRRFCERENIILEHTAPHSSYQNGAIESTIGYLKKKMRTMHIDSGIPKKLWTYSFKHAIFLSNHLTKSNKSDSPIKMLIGKENINPSKLIPFGCQIFLYNYKREQKLFNISNPYIFIGYENNSDKIVIAYDHIKGKIKTSSAWKSLTHMFPMNKYWIDQQYEKDPFSIDDVDFNSFTAFGDPFYADPDEFTMETFQDIEDNKTDRNMLYDDIITTSFNRTNQASDTTRKLKVNPRPETPINKEQEDNDVVMTDDMNLPHSTTINSTTELSTGSTDVEMSSDYSDIIIADKPAFQDAQLNNNPAIDNNKINATTQSSSNHNINNGQNDTDIQLNSKHVVNLETLNINDDENCTTIPYIESVGATPISSPKQSQKTLPSIGQHNNTNSLVRSQIKRHTVAPVAILKRKSSILNSELPGLNTIVAKRTKLQKQNLPPIKEKLLLPSEPHQKNADLSKDNNTQGTDSLNTTTKDTTMRDIITTKSQSKSKVSARISKPTTTSTLVHIPRTSLSVVASNKGSSKIINQKPTVISSRTRSKNFDRASLLNQIINQKSSDISKRRGNPETHLLVSKDKYVIPITFKDVLKSKQKDQWIEAIKAELESMIEQRVYTEIKKSNVPKQNLLIKARWVFTVKEEANGKHRFKARLVAKGFTQRIGENFIDSYAPVVKDNTMRMLFCLTTLNDWKIKQLDVKNAFLHGNIDYDTYMVPPDGTRIKKNFVWKLNKSLYGLKQAPHIWFNTLKTVLVKNKLVNSILDPCLFHDNRKETMILIYVDDILIIGKTQKHINNITNILKKSFEMKDLGKPSMFLGLNLNIKSNNFITLSLQSTIQRIAKDFDIITTSKQLKTPMIKGLECNPLTESSPLTTEEQGTYRSLVGTILFIARMGRPDISFVVSYLSTYLQSAKQAQLKAAHRVIHYLLQTKSYSIKFTQNNNLNTLFKDFRYIDKTKETTIKDYKDKTDYRITVFVDASWGNHIDDRKSHSGYIVFLNDNIVAWNSRKLKTIADSSTEAEYMAIAEAAKEGVYFKNLLTEIGYDIGYINICVDNHAALTLSAHSTQHQRTKHIDIKYHKIRQLVENKIIKLNYVNTKLNVADMLTKSFDSTRFQQLINLIKIK